MEEQKFYKVLERTYVWDKDGKEEIIVPRVLVLNLLQSPGSMSEILERGGLLEQEIQFRSMYPLKVDKYNPSNREGSITREYTYVFKEITEGEYLVLDLHMSKVEECIDELTEIIGEVAHKDIP